MASSRRGAAHVPGAGLRGMMVLAVGFVTLLGQVVLLREVGVAFYGSELAYVLGFGVWLVRHGPRRGRSRDRDPVVALRLAGWAVPAALVLARALRPLLGTVTGAEPGLWRLGPRPRAGAGPGGVPRRGRLPPRRQCAARRRRHAGADVRRRDAWARRSAGSVATLLPAVGAPGLAGAWLVVLVASLAGRRAVGRDGGRAGRARRRRPRSTRYLTRWTHPDLLATRDAPYGRLTLDGREGQVAVFVDDALAYESQGTTAEEFAAHRRRAARDARARCWSSAAGSRISPARWHLTTRRGSWISNSTARCRNSPRRTCAIVRRAGRSATRADCCRSPIATT